MKKALSLLAITIFILSVMTACCFPKIVLPTVPGSTAASKPTAPKPNSSVAPNTDPAPTVTPSPSTGGNEIEVPVYTYTSFTPAEKQQFVDLIGEELPFLPNNEYYVEASNTGGQKVLNFYTLGNTASDFEAYRSHFSSYTLTNTYEDNYGDTWYVYEKRSTIVEMSWYELEGTTCTDIYVSLYTDNSGSNGEFIFTDFTEDEKKQFRSIFADVIPFIPNNEYYLEEYTMDGEEGLNFYTFGNTKEDFEAYLNDFSTFTYEETYEDEYGDPWYVYRKGNYYVDLSWYETDGSTCVDVYVYILTGSGGTGGGNTDNSDLITNNGQGLPEGTDGVYDVDFTDAEYVKDVTDQGYYLDGCPTEGKPGVLVIPVDFSDATAQSKGYDLSAIVNAFSRNGETDYYSVYDYYYISSFGKLELDITVLDFWFRPEYSSEYYANATMDYYGEEMEIGDQMILNEALVYLAEIMDLSRFDSDNNGTIDAVVLINTLDIGEDDFHWAYRYWNIYSDENDEYYTYDGVSANDYLWASYQFLHECYDSAGNVSYDDTAAVNTYTYIHEFGHILGADDYYDTAGSQQPMGGADVMDGMAGDHNAFTKFNFGWITSSRLVTADGAVTLTLRDFASTGDTIIIANNWDPTLGAYQEYYIVAYYTSTGLNSGSGGYFGRDGIVVYHVNASLYREELDGEVYYDIYNNNTSSYDEYGTADNLIEYVKSGEGNFTYVVGESMPAVTDDNGDSLCYIFNVDAMNDDSATLTFVRIG